MGNWVNRTTKGFVGNLASGRGVNVTAEDDRYLISSDREVPQWKKDEAIRAGFDDVSVGELTILEGKKSEVRDRINRVSAVMVGPDTGRGR